MRKPLVVGNWKMHHGGHSALELAKGCAASARTLPRVDLVIAPPFTALAAVAAECDGSPLSLAAQNVHPQPFGAYTGEISPLMLQESGCRWVILGHSERRTFAGESDAHIAEKMQAVLHENLSPILCVGETLAERENGKTDQVIERQLKICIPLLTKYSSLPAAIAYEPIWAIGTGTAAHPEEVAKVHASIRHQLAQHDRERAERVRLLYGGSLNATNAFSLFSCPHVDGGLIGSASLDAQLFGAIARIASELTISPSVQERL
ncbi:triose-phosphate isomerase [Pajaroellobacter abortibovis]|uniref:Triosephosphate isomerase n=2 Tax=Pajaroellobacter abortibovis TaxID=1882918 RepID=A0A1L6MZ96_9BACT|nr:triose-phosphate isomerase [Pajaroellobacter abortibovis]